MTRQEFWDRLNVHDWGYKYSDDNRAWQKGFNNESELRKIADAGGYYYRLMYAKFYAHHNADPQERANHKLPCRPRASKIRGAV